MDLYSISLLAFALICVGVIAVALMAGLNHLEADEADPVVGDVPNLPKEKQ
jgi:hypothetical protein